MDSKFAKLLVLTTLSILGGIVFSLLAIYSCSFIFDIPYDNVSAVLSSLNSPKELAISKIILFCNSFGIFVAPSLLFAILFYNKPFRFLKLNRIDSVENYLILIFIFISFLPLLNVIVELNKNMVLPEFLAEIENWMRLKEDAAQRMTDSLLKMNNTYDLLLNIFLIGIVPAIGEELLFRGLVQQIINKGQKNYHIGVWASAFIFSAIHFQFYGFIPRMLLGALFGYLFHWSANLWIPIFAHFLNNSVAVLVVYYFRANGFEKQIEQVGTTESTWPMTILFTILFCGLLYYFKKMKWKEKMEPNLLT